MAERSSLDNNSRLLSAMTPCQMLNLWSRNNQDTDTFSFEDSDRFEEDSLCSWSSEHESLCNNWRGWKKPNTSSDSNNAYSTSRKNSPGKVYLLNLTSLLSLLCPCLLKQGQCFLSLISMCLVIIQNSVK